MSLRLSLWHGDTPLVLASASLVRRALLDSAGIQVEVMPASVDERTLESQLPNSTTEKIALHLAEAKAEQVSTALPGRLVLGADQTLALGAHQLHKPINRQQAADHLAMMSGKRHALHSALALARNGRIIWHHVETAPMRMRPLSAGFIHAYLDAAGSHVLGSVGVYQIENLGLHLFDEIGGDHTTIMGLPLLPLLRQLRNMDLVHA